MSTEVKDAEVVDTTTGEVTSLSIRNDVTSLVKEQDIPLMRIMENSSLDWKSLKPNQMAVLLMAKPFMAGGGTMYLNFRQALLFATRCYELGLSPFSGEVWYDANRGSVNLSLEGKRQLARIRGIDLRPPQFEELSREWKDVRTTEAGEAAKKLGFPKDIGVKCRIRVGPVENKEFSEYICWLSEWLVARSPVWQTKSLHMLQTRATEKAISMALGTGASSMVGNEPDGE
jgi:hypothetical protein